MLTKLLILLMSCRTPGVLGEVQLAGIQRATAMANTKAALLAAPLHVLMPYLNLKDIVWLSATCRRLKDNMAELMEGKCEPPYRKLVQALEAASPPLKAVLDSKQNFYNAYGGS